MTVRRRLGLAWGAVLVVGATAAPFAHAEGGLPGSPKALDERAQVALAAQGVAMLALPTATENSEGAIFSPFAELSFRDAPRQLHVVQDSDPRTADRNVTLVVAAAGVAAIAWLLLKDV